jgi:uncharacterized protein
MADINDFAKFTERYVAVWNEPDLDGRRAAVTEIWSPHARCCTANGDHRGLAEIEARVTAAYEKWVVGEGHVFRPLAVAEGHHGGVRLRWEMVPATGGAAASAGVQFLLLDEDGRVLHDYQFIDM